MEYAFARCNDAIVVDVHGRVDEASWTAFGVGLGEAIEKASNLGLREIVINLAELEYMSSRGLRVLTVTKREAGEVGISVSLASPNEVMREILAISRYDKLFTIMPTVQPVH